MAIVVLQDAGEARYRPFSESTPMIREKTRAKWMRAFVGEWGNGSPADSKSANLCSIRSSPACGALAHLVERKICILEVKSSKLLCSTGP